MARASNRSSGDDSSGAPKSGVRKAGIDPTWPESGDGDHALSEFTADRQGSLSPFGDLEFPRDTAELPYIHPTTIINR